MLAIRKKNLTFTINNIDLLNFLLALVRIIVMIVILMMITLFNG